VNFEELLKAKACDCGMVHSCSIDKVVIGAGALKEVPGLISEYEHILLVADINTYEVCGKLVEEQIHKVQLTEKIEGRLIYKRDGLLIPNEEAVGEMEDLVSDTTDLILGIGSGVIQDLCKYVSFEKKIPYYIVATAPSMDGYASKGAAMITDNMKVTYNAHVPAAIIGDIDILKDAPMELIQSGYGDILGKYSCLNDWKLSAVVNGEYFCDYVYNLTYEMLLKTRDLGQKLQARDPEAIGTLMEALVGVGIAMAYVGNSRPASGSEHHLSHFFEVTGILNDEPYFMHGVDVAYSAVYTQRIREALLQIEIPLEHQLPTREIWEKNIRKVYTAAGDGVIALQDKMGWYNQDRVSVYRKNWKEIKEVLSEVPSSEQLAEYLTSVGLDIAEYERMYGCEKIRDALLYAKDLKDRYSVLWMYYDLMA